MSHKKTKAQPAKQIHPIAAEFQSSCKATGFVDDETIQALIPILTQNDTHLRLTRLTISAALGKTLLRLIQKYNKFQNIVFFACPILDFSFYKQFSTDLIKSSCQHLGFDYAPIPRETILPFLTLPSLESLSLRGNQCLTSYDYKTHQPFPFPASLNLFFNTLCGSTLKVLNLSGCHLGDDGAGAFACSLFFNTNLRCISLAGNRITDVGARYIASALGHYYLNENEQIVVDKLTGDDTKQKISDEGGNLIRKKKGAPAKPPPRKTAQRTVRSKGTLQKMSLSDKAHSFDPSAPVSAQVFAKWNSVLNDQEGRKYLQGNVTLTSLVLDDNRIGQSGFDALKEMLKLNVILKMFSIQNNPEILKEDADLVERIPPLPTAH